MLHVTFSEIFRLTEIWRTVLAMRYLSSTEGTISNLRLPLNVYKMVTSKPV